MDIFRATALAAFRRDWSFRDQIRRAAVSIPSNIAEGNQRGSDRDCARFFYFAKGSAAELVTHIEIAKATGFIEGDAADRWLGECDEIARMLAALIRHRTRSEAPVPSDV